MPRTHLPDRDLYRAEPLGVRTPGASAGPGRSAGRSDSCASREPPLQDWLGNWQLRGIPCGPISSHACKPHLMTPPASQACRYWELMSMCGITRTDADEGPVSSPASWTTRGTDHPTARLLDLVPGRSGTVHENWLEERGEQFRSGIQIATLEPFQGQQERHRRPTPRRHQRARCLPYRQARWRRSR